MSRKIATVFISVLAIAAPSTALAINTGYGAAVDCTPSTAASQTGHLCGDDQDQFRRIYDLEVAVQQLQAANAQLDAKIGAIKPVQQVVQAAPAPTVPSTDPQTLQRVTILETKVSKLEQAMSFLQDTLLTAVNKTISLLTKLLAK